MTSVLVALPIQQSRLTANSAGTGTVVYPNKDKYEGDWVNGKRHGVGALWLHDSDRYRIQYTGEWQKDKFHVSLTIQSSHPIAPPVVSIKRLYL